MITYLEFYYIKIATNTQFTYHNFVLEWLFSEKGDMLISFFLLK